jgi:hypothetical protein
MHPAEPAESTKINPQLTAEFNMRMAGNHTRHCVSF